MHASDLMCSAIDFIEGHLREDITVADMADAVGYSLYHFCRLFNQATHHTPYDYLMRRRLAEAARDLVQTDQRIIDIAFGYRFNSHETFSRAFKRVVGMQPSELRKQARLTGRRSAGRRTAGRWLPSRHLMPRLTRAHLQHLHKGPYLKPVLVEEPAFQISGLMTTVRKDPDDVSELWGLLSDELDRHGEHSETGDDYGLAWYPEGWEERGYLFMIGVEAPRLDVSHTPLVVKTVPAQHYARFVHKGTRRDLPLTLDYIYHTWLPKSGAGLDCSWVLEHYAQGFRGFRDPESEWTIDVPIQWAPGRDRAGLGKGG